MRRLVWALGWIAVAVWSLVAWSSYGLLELFGGLAARTADWVIGQPEGVEMFSWAVTALQGLGLAAIVTVWAIVSLVILAVTAVLARIAGAASRPAHPGPAMRYDVRQDPPAPPRRQGPPSAVQDQMRRLEKR